MNKLPFFNWSIKKTLDTEPDSLTKARISIMYTVLLFSIAKIIIVLTLGYAEGQWLQLVRAAVVFIMYISMLKILLSRPSQMIRLAHTMLWIGVLIVWTNIFVYSHKINLLTVQFIFMVVLCSFYIMGSKRGTFYSIISIFPAILFLALRGNPNIYLTHTPQEFPSPGFEIIVVLNFMSIITAHYLFYEAFHLTITEKERLNKELQQSIAEAHKLAESKSNFLSTMSHELRTPLNSVVSIAELLLEEKPDERQKENLKILQFSALDLLSLINNVLDFNKMDANRMVLEKTPFSLSEFMRNICSGLRIKAQDKKLSFVLDIDPQLEQVYVVSDPTRLAQVIYNLVGNALKFTDSGSITVKLALTAKAGADVSVSFSVTDTGTGIHPERHKTIFELFTQAESHITRKYGGTGLGLTIVKQVLILFNSAIQLESSPGNGASFSFAILFATTAELPEPARPASAERTDIGHLKVLIAEDIPVNRLIMKKQLQNLGITPVMAENGMQAYEACMAGCYDAVFMDLHMPVLDGYEATRHIRRIADREKASVYIVAFTASVSTHQEILDAGFDDFLYKPVNMNDLRDKLEKIALRSC